MNGKPIVSPQCRIRHRRHFRLGRYSIVDDFCYFSTKVDVGRCSHLASGCSIAGGSRFQFRMGDFSSLSSGVKIWCASNNFVSDLVAIMPPDVVIDGTEPIEGDVTLENFTGVGANSVIMPGVVVPEGTVIGSLSYVPPHSILKPWMVYAGIPARPLKRRNRKNVLRQAAQVCRFLGITP